MNLDPKELFNQSEARPHWHDAMAASWFEAGVQAALLDMQKSLPKPEDVTNAAANSWRMQGALTFVWHMMNLTEKVEVKKPLPVGKLNHNV